MVKSHAAGYLTTAVSQGIKNTFLRALAPVFAAAPKKLLRILPTIFADFILARQSHSSCTHEKLLTREIEITMAWTQNY